MTFDKLLADVRRELHPATVVDGLVVAVVVKHLGFVIDEATGEVRLQTRASGNSWEPPRQQNVRHSGQVGRKRRK